MWLRPFWLKKWADGDAVLARAGVPLPPTPVASTSSVGMRRPAKQTAPGPLEQSGVVEHGTTTESELAVFVDEARPPGIATHCASAAPAFPVSPGKAGPSCPGSTGTTDGAATAVAMSAGGARPVGIARHSAFTESGLVASPCGPEQPARPVPTRQQPQSLLVELGLLGSQSTVPFQNLNSQCLPAKLGALVPQQPARPVPT